MTQECLSQGLGGHPFETSKEDSFPISVSVGSKNQTSVGTWTKYLLS